MGLRYANPLQSEFRETNSMVAVNESGSKNLYVKFYPKFFKREDIHGDFVAVQREIRNTMPDAHIIKEDVDSSCARVQFDVPTSQEVMLEKLLGKRGFVLIRR